MPEIYLMSRMLLGGIACLFCLAGYTQNLVGNNGFEERNVCTEYNVRCAPEAWFFLPSYSRMSPTELQNHYEVILMGEPREDFTIGNFMYTKLFCPLIAQTEYRLSFSIYIPTFDFDYLDIWLNAAEPGRSRKTSVFSARPVHTIPPDSVSGNKKRWMQVNYTFTAKGGERFLMLGNLQHKALTKAKRSSRKKRKVEYWIDDIVLQPVNDQVTLCPEYEAIKDQVYRNNGRHPARFIENIPIDSSLIDVPPREDSVVVVVPPVITPAPVKTDTLIIPDVLFQFNSSKLNPAFAKRIDSLGEKIVTLSFSKLLIGGHTDNVGSDEYNLQLSADRALTIKNYLINKFKLPAGLIETSGYGESQPRATNATAPGRQQNRRVEIIIYYK